MPGACLQIAYKLLHISVSPLESQELSQNILKSRIGQYAQLTTLGF